MQEQHGQVKQELCQARSDCEQARTEAAKKARKRAKNAVHVASQCDLGTVPAQAVPCPVAGQQHAYHAALPAHMQTAAHYQSVPSQGTQHQDAHALAHSTMAPPSGNMAMGLPLQQSFAAVQSACGMSQQRHASGFESERPEPAVAARTGVAHQDQSEMVSAHLAAQWHKQQDAVPTASEPLDQSAEGVQQNGFVRAQPQAMAPHTSLVDTAPSCSDRGVQEPSLAAVSSQMSADENVQVDVLDGRLAAVAALQVRL